MLFVIAIITLAQPAGPPFQYDLSNPCDDIEDDGRWQSGLVSARLLSDVASGRLDRSVVASLSAMVDAYHQSYDSCDVSLAQRVQDFFGLPVIGSDIDGREDAMIRDAYTNVLGQLRGDAKYLRRVQPIRIQMQAWLTEMLQQSLTCRSTAKAGMDASPCEAALGDLLSQFTSGFTSWIQGSAGYWAAQGELIDSGAATIASDQSRVAQLMTQSKQERDTVDQQFWPQMLDLQNQAQTALANRDWCKAMADSHAAQGDFATANSYMYWYGYYDHQFVTLTTQVIPALSNQMQAFENDAASCDAQVMTLSSEIQQLTGRDSVAVQKLVSGVL